MVEGELGGYPRAPESDSSSEILGGVEPIVEPVSGDPARGAGERVASARAGGARWVAHPATRAGREWTPYWADW